MSRMAHLHDDAVEKALASHELERGYSTQLGDLEMTHAAMRPCFAVILSGAAIGAMMATPAAAQYYRYGNYGNYGYYAPSDAMRPSSPYSPNLPSPRYGRSHDHESGGSR